MSTSPTPGETSRRLVFESSISGAQQRPYIPRLRSDATPLHLVPRSLQEYREREGIHNREARLRSLWRLLPNHRRHTPSRNTETDPHTSMDAELASRLWAMYEEELVQGCSSQEASHITFKEFAAYADRKEEELWHIFHDELDLDSNGHLDAEELAEALGKAGINLRSNTLSEFMTFLSSSPHSHAISFPEFRDFLLLLPRRASTKEIFKYYEVRRLLGDERGATRVNMEGDVSLGPEDLPPQSRKLATSHLHGKDNEPILSLDEPEGQEVYDDEYGYDVELEEEEPGWTFGPTSRYLLAGGIAGAVSRTSTAPFDRLKIFLITRPPDLGGVAGTNTLAHTSGVKALLNALTRLYAEGGIRAFWVGNGLNLIKIFPESAVKFMTYEQTKRLFAKHWDHVEDPRYISGGSRFISGGMGGICSQLFIYPIETLKTQMMSSTGDKTRSIASSINRLRALGGFPAFYRGLTIGIIGVFPYSAIDMSTFEALKLAYLRSTGKEEPGVLAILAFGSMSGSIGASTVYPLNLVRTRLQASGSTGHPQRYTGVMDVARKTYAADGWRGFYRGLLPTLAKVVPSVSISYVVYETAKRKLGV
ncbi:hypothetical protein M422DRAFT_238480 [Sphaerobolus stellatus SS14]|nr:hypothetical protein M422DRAFT_238480 [Sphaerobolus stellatus SS14]